MCARTRGGVSRLCGPLPTGARCWLWCRGDKPGAASGGCQLLAGSKRVISISLRQHVCLRKLARAAVAVLLQLSAPPSPCQCPLELLWLRCVCLSQQPADARAEETAATRMGELRLLTTAPAPDALSPAALRSQLLWSMCLGPLPPSRLSVRPAGQHCDAASHLSRAQLLLRQRTSASLAPQAQHTCTVSVTSCTTLTATLSRRRASYLTSMWLLSTLPSVLLVTSTWECVTASTQHGTARQQGDNTHARLSVAWG
jgi:hypothetical protein